MTGLLLGADAQVRSWISFYIRNGQKKHNESLAAFRAKLLDQLKNLIMEAKEYQQRDGAISQVIFDCELALAVLYFCFRLLVVIVVLLPFLNLQAHIEKYFPFPDWNMFLTLIGIFSFF